MKIYRIFLKKDKNGVIEDLQILKEGFSFYTFIFQYFYLLLKKLWLQALIMFSIMNITNILMYKYNLFFISIPIQLCYLIYSSYEMIDWETNKFKKNNYEYLGYTSGKDEREAKLKFLEQLNKNHPENDKLEKLIY